MTLFRKLDGQTLVAGQIAPAGVAEAAAAGVKTIINNRPDGEEPGQPTSAEIEAAAKAIGLGYRYVPIAGGVSQPQVEAMVEALENCPVLAFCRSGTRSTYLWALARARLGDDPDALLAAAASAGYDLRPIAPHLRRS